MLFLVHSQSYANITTISFESIFSTQQGLSPLVTTYYLSLNSMAIGKLLFFVSKE